MSRCGAGSAGSPSIDFAPGQKGFGVSNPFSWCSRTSVEWGAIMTNEIRRSRRGFGAYAGLGCAFLLSACSSIPDVEIAYYLPTSRTVLTVTQVVDCTTDNKTIIVGNTPTASSTYVADIKKRHTVNLREIEGAGSFLVDSDAKFTFYEDGRLKAVGQFTQGQAEAFVKSAIQLGTSSLSAVGIRSAVDSEEACKTIAAWGHGKPVAITYASVPIDLVDMENKDAELNPIANSEPLYRALAKNLPELKYKVGAFVPNDRRAYDTKATDNQTSPGNIALMVQDTGRIPVTFYADDKTILATEVLVPGKKAYPLPIPRAALFGKQSFSLVLTEAGGISEISYGKNAGASGAANAAAAISDTSAVEVAATKAQADLIYQQQRLARCQQNPTACTAN